MKRNIRNSLRLIIAISFLLSLAGKSVAQVQGLSDFGIKDFSYGTSASAPTGQKPQSKLWFQDGIWWGILYNKTTSAFEIYSLDWSSQTWQSTGVLVDSRPRTSADVLWTGDQLFIASAMNPNLTVPDKKLYVKQFSYDAISKTYALVSYTELWGFAVESVVIDIDTTGTLWATFTDYDQSGVMSVFVAHTQGNQSNWTTPYVLPISGADNLAVDDISTLVAYNGKIGVLWSNQVTGDINFAYHLDGAGDDATDWTFNPAVSGLPNYADDHLNIKSLNADSSGQLFAVIKTSLNDTPLPNSGQPLIVLLILDNNGSWSRKEVATVADNHTRPIVLIDNQNRQLYVFMTLQYSGQPNGAIYYKQIDLDDSGAQFPAGIGTPFIEFTTDTHINNASSTKQVLNGITDLVVIASDDHSRYYFHNFMDLQDPEAPPPPPVFNLYLPIVVK
ncbi:MAG: hypothetical protein ACYC3H_05685 [Bellilinea sp.]